MQDTDQNTNYFMQIVEENSTASSGTVTTTGQWSPAKEPSDTCPNCGYCKHCGRGGHQMTPYYPYYPLPYYPGWPTYPTWYNSSVAQIGADGVPFTNTTAA